MNEIEKRLFAANKKLYQTAKQPLRSHGPDHHYRVYMHALGLAKKMGVEYDEDVLAGACLLHDMAAYYPEKTGEQYHDFDHKIAQDVLKEIDFPEYKIVAVVSAIANHGSDPKYKNQDEPVEVTILRDADKLDVFGPIGVARIIMVRTLKGDTMQQIVDDFYTGGHLKRKWDSITYNEAKEMAKADYDYSVAFFARLAETIS